MIAGPVRTGFLPFVLLMLLCSCSERVIQTTVFSDAFDEIDPGPVVGADQSDPAAYFLPGRATAGNWNAATSLRQDGFNDAWQVLETGDGNLMAQTFTNLDKQNKPLSLITHPMLVTGDSLWDSYTIEVDFSPMARFDKCGLVFGYQHPNEYYFFGTEGNIVTLKQVQQSVTPLRPIERILDYRPLVWTPGEQMRAVVTVRRNTISAILNDSIWLRVENEPIRPGRIGLLSDLPAVFSRVEVKLLKGVLRRLGKRRRQQERKQELHLSDHPEMVRWKRFRIEDFGTDQNIRLGDLTGDGNKEILFVRQGAGSGEGICCISAMTLEGELMWQYGDPGRDWTAHGDEVPVQVHDLDGDGKREVVFVTRGEIRILDGKSGKLVQSAGVPELIEARSLVFADLLGTGRDNSLLLTDRVSGLVVLNEQLELLWSREMDAACHPQVFDLDGDGYDEILIGFSAFDHEGNLLFNTGAYMGDICNGVTVYELIEGENTTPCLVYAAGDWGVLYVDFEGKLLKQNIIGHVRQLGVADYNAESPGLELVTSNGWGSNGLVHVSDATGQVRHHMMPAAGISRCLPVNWKGDGEEFFIVSADSITGGMFDHAGQLSVRFPADGHPLSCYMVQDLTGDARDEVLVWDSRELWIYTQDDNPRMGNTYNPDRIPLYNHAACQMHLSLPGW